MLRWLQIGLLVCFGIILLGFIDVTFVQAFQAKSAVGNVQQTIFNNLAVKTWKGQGRGGETTGQGNVNKKIFVAKGEGRNSLTVIVADTGNVQLSKGHYYVLSTKVKSEGVENYFDFIAALRQGKNRDVYEKYNNIDSWTPLTLLLHPVGDVHPVYFAVRLHGKGSVFAEPFSLHEISKDQFEKEKKKLKAERIARERARLEKIFLPYTPSLPLPDNESPEQFKIWGRTEDSYPPVPYGWKRVPGEQPVLESEVTDLLKNTDYLVYSRPVTTPVFLDSVPKAREIIHKLSAQVTPGEYKPLTFAVYSAKGLSGIRVRITDLKSDQREILKNYNIDIRTVNFARKIKNKGQKTYYLMPLTLGKGPDWISEKTSRRYWLTVYVPPKTSPGVYSGMINIATNNALEIEIPVKIDVLPFTLLDPPLVRFMWGPPKSHFPENQIKMYKDMALHGMSTMMVSGGVKSRDQKIDGRDIEHIIRSIDKKTAIHDELGFRDLPIGGISSNQIIFYWDKRLKWFRFWPISSELDREFISAYRDVFFENNQPTKRSKMLEYLVDEPGGANPKNLEPAQHYLKLLKKEFPQLKTFVTIGGGMKQGYDEVGMLSPYLDVTCTNYVTKDVIDRLKKLRSEFWIYNGSSLNVETKKERFFFGLYAWKIGTRGIGQWTYAWTGSPFRPAFRDGRQDYALETKGGYLPTVGLEMIREGINDYRYIYTLSKLIQHGLLSGDQKLHQTAENVHLKLDAILEKVNLNYLRGGDVPESRVVGISGKDFDVFRSELSSLIDQLLSSSNISWATMREQLRKDPERSYSYPSDKDWAQARQTQALGKDLLAEAKFGTFFSDWKFQIWKGRGGGDFASGPRHNKERSAKLYVSSDNNGDNGVLILNHPDVLLKKGVRYRISTWLKTEGVSRNTFLYAAVRSGGVRDVSSQKIHGTFDWRHVWLEFTPDKNCKARYFAVRLWGQGIVYVDKITLQALE